jgi:hypothetical protein
MTSRNDPCPCNSGKKFKKCCLLKDTVSPPSVKPAESYTFVPGSYGGPGSFIPSIACKKRCSTNESTYHFVLVNPDVPFPNEDFAARTAELDLELAFQEKASGRSDLDVAQSLKDAGYLSVTDFKIIKEQELKNG